MGRNVKQMENPGLLSISPNKVLPAPQTPYNAKAKPKTDRTCVSTGFTHKKGREDNRCEKSEIDEN